MLRVTLGFMPSPTIHRNWESSSQAPRAHQAPSWHFWAWRPWKTINQPAVHCALTLILPEFSIHSIISVVQIKSACWLHNSLLYAWSIKFNKCLRAIIFVKVPGNFFFLQHKISEALFFKSRFSICQCSLTLVTLLFFYKIDGQPLIFVFKERCTAIKIVFHQD